MRWGVPLPIEGTDGKVVYVWFDAPIGYISSTKAYFESRGEPNMWKRYWQGSGRIIHFIGKDIIYHHAIFWPALLMGTGEFNIPDAIVASEYLTLEGKKMSKSRGWFISIDGYLKNFAPDPMRYYLVSVAPLERDADFSVDEFIKRYNDELADILGNFIHRTLTFIERFFASAVPEAKLSDADQGMLAMITKTQAEVASDIEQLKFREGLVAVMTLAREGNKYLNDSAPWAAMKTDQQKAAATLYTSAHVVKALGSLLSPYLPFTSEKIWQMLGIEQQIHKSPWAAAAESLPAGHKIGKPEPLFKKIQAADIAKVKTDLIPFKDIGTRIKMDDFKKAKIAIGEVVKAERIKGSRDLLHLNVDLGEYGVRSCVAGVAKYYSPEELLKKKIAVLMNVEVSTLFGVKSEVMLLAAEGEEKVSVLVPDKLVPPGSGVR
jgi:methionyl-tRNA synthetase